MHRGAQIKHGCCWRNTFERTWCQSDVLFSLLQMEKSVPFVDTILYKYVRQDGLLMPQASVDESSPISTLAVIARIQPC